MAESLPRLKVGPGLAKQSCDGPGSVAMIESLIMAVFLSTAGLTSVGVGGSRMIEQFFKLVVA